MSTRSGIGILNTDGTVTAIYCHFDGYPDHHAPILVGHYETEEKVRALLAPGDMSSLGPSVGERHDFNARPDGVCTYYGRDRGEEGTNAREFSSVDLYTRARRDSFGADYLYLFRDGEWFMTGSGADWMRLAPIAKEIEDERKAARVEAG